MAIKGIGKIKSARIAAAKARAPKTVRLTLDAETHRKLMEQARARGMSLTHFITRRATGRSVQHG